MKQNNRVNVLVVATASGIVYGVVLTLFVPFCSILLLSLSAPDARQAATEPGMLLAVLTPLISIGFGFALGALMAFGYNIFAWALLPSTTKAKVAGDSEVMIRAARDRRHLGHAELNTQPR